MHYVANRQRSLIDKGFAKSRRQIYELIGLLAHPIKSLINHANLKERLGLRFTKIRKRLVISEWNVGCLADVHGGEIIGGRTSLKGRLQEGEFTVTLFSLFLRMIVTNAPKVFLNPLDQSQSPAG